MNTRNDLGLGFLLLFLYLPATWLLGLCDLTLGVRALSVRGVLTLIPLYFLFLALVHLFLVTAWATLVEPSLGQRGAVVRFSSALLFFAPPLLSFGYYLGAAGQWFDFHELFLSIFAAVLLGFVAYGTRRRRFHFSFMTGSALFIPLFLTNDVLLSGSYLIAVAPKAPLYYALKSALMVLSLWWVSCRHHSIDSSIRAQGLFQSLALFVAYLMALRGVQLAWGASRPLLGIHPLDGQWVVILGAVYFFYRRTWLGYWVCVASALGSLVTYLWQIGNYLKLSQANFEGTTGGLSAMVGFALFTTLFFFLTREGRSLFSPLPQSTTV